MKQEVIARIVLSALIVIASAAGTAAAQSKIYWVDSGIVYRAGLEGRHMEHVLDVPDVSVSGPVSVDPLGGHLYWSMSLTNFGQIRRANLDGSGVEDVIDGLNAPTGIALDLGQGAIDIVVGTSTVDWSEVDGGLQYDVVLGNLSSLRDTQGDFQAATAECLANDVAPGGIEFVDDPAVGEGFWFLVRAVTSSGNGTYDGAGFPQLASRDAGIAAAQTDCE